MTKTQHQTSTNFDHMSYVKRIRGVVGLREMRYTNWQIDTFMWISAHHCCLL